MPVRKTEQHLPPGYFAEDLGQSSESTDGNIALISFNGSSVVQGRLQSYVVFVLDSSLAAQVDHFEWIMKSDVEENLSSKSGFISFRPASGEDLTVTATLKGRNDENLGQVQLVQSIIPPNPELEELFKQTSEAAPLALNPETSREVINDLWPFISELLSSLIDKSRENGENIEDVEDVEASINLLVFLFCYIGLMQIPFEIYNTKLEQIADALNNDDPSLFLEEGDAGIGVCRLIPYVLGMYIPETPGHTNYYLPKKEYPAKESERLEFRQKLKKELENLNIEKQIDLFNLIRFPKSNIQMAIKFLNGIQQDYFPGESIYLLSNSEQQENSLFDRYLQKVSERMNNFKSSPVKSMLSAVAPLYSLFANAQESQDWSGTNPPILQKRLELKKAAEYARKTDNPNNDNALLQAIWNDPATEFESNHVIIGAGYAAVINAVTLSSGPLVPLLSTIMIGESEPWSTYQEKLMGQSPTNLSPSAFRVLPLHLYGIDYPRKPQNCLKHYNLSNCYLSSENFSLAIALTRNQLSIPALKGMVQAVNSQGGYYIVTVLLQKGTQKKTVKIKTKKLDFCGGPGPPRKLPDTQFHDKDVRKKLRENQGNGFRKHLFGGEALQENEKLPPPGQAKIILIYGGSPTSAWVYERLFKILTIFDEDIQAEPYEVIWVAPLLWRGTGEDDLTAGEKKKIAFGAIDIGLRNKMVLQHSMNRRFVAKITNVVWDTDRDQVKVTFNKDIGNPENKILYFDQIIESIGLDPNRTGGVNDILSGFQGRFEIIQDSYGDRPLGLKLNEGDRKLRILGAAAVAASREMLPSVSTQGAPGFGVLALSDDMSSEMLFYGHDYAIKMRAFLESLPEESRVPPGITVAGLTISRANIPSFALSHEINININTASLEELKARTVDDPDSTMPLFTTQEAEGIVECRKNMKFGIPKFPGQPSGTSKHWIPGFISILKPDIERCENLEFDDYNKIKKHIRV